MVNSSHLYRLDSAGEPVPCDDVIEWGEWFERSQRTGERVLAHDRNERRAEGEPEIFVSTVFLAIDSNFLFNGPPVLWETMVFGGLLDGEMQRYTSRAEALRGHRAMCKRVMESLR
jgi:hypothetical protein